MKSIKSWVWVRTSVVLISSYMVFHSTPGHYDDVIMTMLASQITSLTVVYSIVYSGVNQRKHQSSASLAFVREIHRGPVNFPHKWPVTRNMFPFDDVIMMMLISRVLTLIKMISSEHTRHHNMLSWNRFEHKIFRWRSLWHNNFER